MSIGFSVPIVMLARSPVASGGTIARIMACFSIPRWLMCYVRLVTAGIVSTTAVYLLAVCSQELLNSCARYFSLHRRCRRLGDEEAAFPPKNERSAGRILVLWVLDNSLLMLSWFFTLIICIPLRYATGLEEPLGISLLLAIWTTTQALQSGIRTSALPILCLIRSKVRIVLSVACNPVLWTAMGLIAYAAAESHRSARPVEVVLSTLERNTTFTDLLMRRNHSDTGAYIDFRISIRESSNTDYAHRPTPDVAAGDVANAILSSGLVCWGLKLWEYRRRLLSTAGFTILVVSCAAALANVVLGPLLAKEILGPHSQPGYDLAFIARTVTLALGAPAVAKIGGDVGLNAAMVVVNGIMCQMLLGLGAGEWLTRLMEKGAEPGNNTQGDRITGHDARQGTPAPDERAGVAATSHGTTASSATKNTTTIASGVTVGINAAAMGTAHLYESGSDAAPYSALAMTVFGVATVGFTMIPQLGGWVVARVQ
ncbi:hypothetical protein CONLIGDRAFT_659129 [Coniochaeta ligniaria NRRL 30616]|uniref:Uncharacterized protein n=1 Tax=Coniochaeta ligniaria NRRL 30616 TaxID=1408157 RepID=A0A1J7IYS4_9PEZI|nr:hypothetical protein CONLIGDRAFT_659129 [Coniochaeta ligniaria NRRL 30616]